MLLSCGEAVLYEWFTIAAINATRDKYNSTAPINDFFLYTQKQRITKIIPKIITSTIIF
jgi:hypothetical protein